MAGGPSITELAIAGLDIRIVLFQIIRYSGI
jgi:hypothetical protein